MKELIRDTVFGHALRFVTRGKVLQYGEEKDPELWKQYIDKKASGNMAHHGTPGEEENEKKAESNDDDSESPDRDAQKKEEQNDMGDQPDMRPIGTGTNGDLYPNGDEQRRNGSGQSSGSNTRHGSNDNTHRNETSGVPVDPEKGRDVTVITWYSDDDPEVCAVRPARRNPLILCRIH